MSIDVVGKNIAALRKERNVKQEELADFEGIEIIPFSAVTGEGVETLREILVPIFKNGQCVYESPKVMEIREYCNREKDTLWDETKRFINPHKVYVDLSKKLYDIKIQLLDQMSEK